MKPHALVKKTPLSTAAAPFVNLLHADPIFPRKVVIAKAVHEKTAVSRRWTAARLEMKSAMNVSQQIRRLKAGELKLSKEAKQWLSRIAP